MPDAPNHLTDQPIHAFLAALAARTPTPGGGAVASVVGALSAALGRMVLAYTVGRKTPEDERADLERASAALERASGLLLELAEEDAAAYGLLSELLKLAEDDPRRVREYPGAVAAAVQAPLATTAACCDVLRLLESLAGRTNRRLDSDLAIAAILAEAGAKAGAWNVRVNLPMLSEEEQAGPAGQVERYLQEAARRRERVERICTGGNGG